MLGGLDGLAVGAGGSPTARSLSSTATGTQADWAPGIVGPTLILWSGASDLTLTGLAGGVDGRIVTVKNLAASAILWAAHQDAGSAAANRFVNRITGGATPIAPTGMLRYQYDAGTARWQLLEHEQGRPITPTFAAGDFTGAGFTWTVQSADVRVDAYVLRGTRVSYQYYYDLTSVSGTPTADLRRALPAHLASAEADAVSNWGRNLDNGTENDGFVYVGSAFGNFLFFRRDKTSGNWALATNATTVQGTHEWEVI